MQAGASGCSLTAGSLDRLLSPLTYQTDRGLQIESFAALPAMALWAVFHDPWQVVFSKYVTSEITGPGTELLQSAGSLATVAAIALMAVLWWRAWRRAAPPSAATIGWVALVSTELFIVTNKVFSPQYLMWLAPVAVAVVAVSRGRDLGARRNAVILLVVGVLTQLIYPTEYLQLTTPSSLNWLGVLLLAVRDLGLIGVTWYAWRRAWQGTRADAAHRAYSTASSS